MLYGYAFYMIMLFGDVIRCEYDSSCYEMHDYMVINYVLMVCIVVVIGGK